MRILITGHKGFIGGSLCQFFSTYHQVFGFDTSVDRNFIEIETRIRNGEFDIVLHFGASANAQAEEFRDLYESNVLLCSRIVYAAYESKTRLLFSSSLAVYGNYKGGEKSPYAQSKYLMERIIEELSLTDSDWDVTILRLANITGVGELHKGNMMSIPSRFILDAHLLKRIEIWTFGEAHSQIFAKRDFLDVADLVQIVNLIVNKKANGLKLFDCGTGKALGFDYIASIVTEFISADIIQIEAPRKVNQSHYQLFTQADTSALLNYIGDFPYKSIRETIYNLVKERVSH